jgi:hypothetical protein
MIDTIGPMVRAADADGRPVELAHFAGGALGGALSGFFAGAVGAIVGLDEGRSWGLLAGVAVFAVAAVAIDALHEGRKLGLARQTPRVWRHVLPTGTAAFLNGFDLGLGWSTRIYFVSSAVALAAAVVSAHALAGAAIGGAFGGVRALFVVLARRRSDGRLSIDSLAARRGRVLVLNGAALLQFAAVAGLAAAALR